MSLPDADNGGYADAPGLYGVLMMIHSTFRGPLIFCLLLSMFLSMRAKGDQASLVFSGVFTIVWIGEAVVTLQIKLLGGHMYVLGGS